MSGGGPALSESYGSAAHWDAVHDASGGRPTLCEDALVGSAIKVAAGLLQGLERRRVLDLAAGSGGLSRALARAGAEVLGSDISGSAMRHAAATARETGAVPAPAYVVMDASRLAVTAAFDVVCCLRSFWVLPDPAACLAEAGQALRPGGWLLVQIWSAPQDCRMLTLGAGLLAHYCPELIRPAGLRGPFDCTPAGLAEAFLAAGLVDCRQESFDLALPVTGAEDYWGEFAAIAGTAHLLYRRQEPALRARIDRHWEALTARLRPAGEEELRLGLGWHVCAARRPG